MTTVQVNVSPSLSSSSPLDKRIKNMLLTDTFHLAGFTPFDPRHLSDEIEKRKMDRMMGRSKPSRAFHFACVLVRVFFCVSCACPLLLCLGHAFPLLRPPRAPSPCPARLH
jgi:hypothetical protein